jgi:hypothetical protein
MRDRYGGPLSRDANGTGVNGTGVNGKDLDRQLKTWTVSS